MIAVWCNMLMSYSKVLAFHHCWSTNILLGNAVIKFAIYQNSCLQKYFYNPKNLKDTSKRYYMEEIVSCLKHTLGKVISERAFQNIDEPMTKFLSTIPSHQAIQVRNEVMSLQWLPNRMHIRYEYEDLNEAQRSYPWKNSYQEINDGFKTSIHKLRQVTYAKVWIKENEQKERQISTSINTEVLLHVEGHKRSGNSFELPQ